MVAKIIVVMAVINISVGNVVEKEYVITDVRDEGALSVVEKIYVGMVILNDFVGLVEVIQFVHMADKKQNVRTVVVALFARMDVNVIIV
jgi:hypothetical protein